MKAHLILAFFSSLLLLNNVFAGEQAHAKSQTESRILVKVPLKVREKMKDMVQVMGMVKITPLVNDADVVVGMEINDITDDDIINVLKARNGDVIKSVRVKKKENGKVTTRTYSVLSPADVMNMYSNLLGAESADVDIKRGKTVVPMTYLFGI